MSNYYTPLEIVKPAKLFFPGGAIELDLCSDERANTIIKAQKFLTDYTEFAPRKVEGLNIWCNPPYERDFITPFFVDWYEKHISIAVEEKGCEILTLVNTQSSARWYHVLLNCSTAMAFFKKRIAFIDPETMQPVKGNRYDQTLFMWSRRDDAFNRFEKSFHSQARAINLSYEF
jgi:hypothetical protein